MAQSLNNMNIEDTTDELAEISESLAGMSEGSAYPEEEYHPHYRRMRKRYDVLKGHLDELLAIDQAEEQEFEWPII